MKPPPLRPYLPRPALRRRTLLPCHHPIPLPSQRRRRNYAVQAPGAPTIEVFNGRTKFLQKERAAKNVERSREVDYLRDEVAMRLVERLLDINRHFPSVLDLGANACNIARALTLPYTDPNQPPSSSSSASPSSSPTSISTRITHLTAADTSPTLLYRDSSLPFNTALNLTRHLLPPTEEPLPFGASTFDAVLSSLSLHWINDLPSLLSQINHILKPDAPFLGAMLGGDSLFELRTSLQLASLERKGGISPHTSPLADVRDVGGLLQKAGFKMLTVDIDDIVVEYPDLWALMGDLQAMGESNAVLGREMGPISRDVLLAAQGIYGELHGERREGREGDEGGKGKVVLPATFRIIYMIGWKEGPNQAKPLERGSGRTNLIDVLGGGEIK